jgi:hypothetical protein
LSLASTLPLGSKGRYQSSFRSLYVAWLRCTFHVSPALFMRIAVFAFSA